ncbi:MAG TPA: hypothetical protein VK559_07660 [Ferruginibacter sp.]|nr:hypothetical protein [Ferruginibacter sp.]
MTIHDTETGKEINVTIERASMADFKLIKKNKEFGFNWEECKNKEVYKLCIVNDEKIQGLMCVFDHTDQYTNAIEIELLELRKENIGHDKKLDRVAGCLIAYACRESIKRGHGGYVFLYPKTSLINHYQSKYGFSYLPFGPKEAGTLNVDGDISRELIKEYLQ